MGDVVRGDPCRAGAPRDRGRMHLPKTIGTASTRASRGHRVPTVGVVPRPPGWEVHQEEAPCNAGHRGGSLLCGVSLVEG